MAGSVLRLRTSASAPIMRVQGAAMPSSIAPPRVHSPSSGSDHVTIGAIAFSSGGLDSLGG